MSKVTVAATQMSCSWNLDANIAKAENLIRGAAAAGGQIILLQELFETPYFCQVKNEDYFALASEHQQNKAIKHFQNVARELEVVLPLSFFETDTKRLYNSVAIIDATGEILGVYRKTHIPDGPGYEEKFYFTPGDTGFKVWKTRYAVIGVGICWDQWFTEAARCMALLGAEILLYPTAIGSEPDRPEVDSKNHWQLCMQGHAAANIVPVVASNRVGIEKIGPSQIRFYGSSFITDGTGAKIAEADGTTEKYITAELDLEQISKYRDYWGIYRDRRPEMYRQIVLGK
ncbi:MAG: N-carbamoylputrescine amidase [Bacteroidota bacterium]